MQKDYIEFSENTCSMKHSVQTQRKPFFLYIYLHFWNIIVSADASQAEAKEISINVYKSRKFAFRLQVCDLMMCQIRKDKNCVTRAKALALYKKNANWSKVFSWTTWDTFGLTKNSRVLSTEHIPTRKSNALWFPEKSNGNCTVLRKHCKKLCFCFA